MNKQEIWNQLCDRHPEFKDPKHVVKLRSRGLKALIDQAYDNGVESVPKRTEDFSNIFGGIFGGRKP